MRRDGRSAVRAFGVHADNVDAAAEAARLLIDRSKIAGLGVLIIFRNFAFL